MSQQLSPPEQGASDFAICELQHAAELALSQQFSRRAAAVTNAGGVTPCFRAQASFSRFEWQQQSRQQVSASLQPQAQCWQGNGSVDFDTVRAGSGTPTEQIATVMHASQAASLCFRGTRASEDADSEARKDESPAGVKPPI